MLNWCLFLAAIFLIWTFFLTTFAFTITRLGETLAYGIIKKYPNSFFYFPFHKWLYEKHSFELLIFSATIGQHLAQLGYAAIGMAFLFLHPAITLEYGIVFSAILLFLILLIGDFFPRTFSFRYPERALAFSLPMASFFLYLSFPFSFLFVKGSDWTMRGSERDHTGINPIEELKETILKILQSVDLNGTLNPSDEKLLTSVLHFKNRIVREVMVPRINLFSLPVTATVRESANLLIEEGYSRVPIYKDTIDNIVGVLMFKDVLELYMDCEKGNKEKDLLDEPIEPIIKKVFYTPETKKVSVLLQELKAKQMHMAIVVDEYGGTEGVVTIEDILEQIVGDIADEYDVDEETLYIHQPGGNGWIVDARMGILDAEATFHIEIPREGDYDTIGGYVFHKVGAIPSRGLKIHHENFDLEILSVSDRNVQKVRITPRRSKEELVEFGYTQKH